MTLRAGLILVACVVALNLNALDAPFIGDDFDFLLQLGRMDSIRETVTYQFWGEWEPLWHATWYLDLAWWGLRPLGFHLTNVAWLTLGVLGLYALVRELWPEASLAPWTAALLFLVHPVHDEAVVYLAARGHVICFALMVWATWMYLRARASAARHARTGWLAAALATAFAAALAKETALVLPVWIAAAEIVLLGRGRSRLRSVLAGLGAGLALAIPGITTLLLRGLVVGFASDKLGGRGLDLPELADDFADDVPVYVLLGGMPLPFAWLDEPVLEAWRPLGWLLLVVVLASGVALAMRREPLAFRASGIGWLGVVIAATALAPIFWADLPLRRRYLFIPTAGCVLVTAALLEWLRARRPRLAVALLALAVAGGALATLERNSLYREAGRVTREIIETVRGAPLGEPPAAGDRRALFVTLPGRWGGDSVSGVYLVHHTDLASALQLAGAPQPQIAYAMRFYHADDQSAELLERSTDELVVRFSFRTGRAFAAALDADPADEGRGGMMQAERIAVDEVGRTMDYRIRLSPRVAAEGYTLYLFSDGQLRPL